ncbi:hypothetical protein C8Q80DRAFT_854624 [Daedaleopsis nitida]|nr:hypothetical protein C8Q80DRAFT_854624 [Daedaleopsis nitida]
MSFQHSCLTAFSFLFGVHSGITFGGVPELLTIRASVHAGGSASRPHSGPKREGTNVLGPEDSHTVQTIELRRTPGAASRVASVRGDCACRSTNATDCAFPGEAADASTESRTQAWRGGTAFECSLKREVTRLSRIRSCGRPGLDIGQVVCCAGSKR